MGALPAARKWLWTGLYGGIAGGCVAVMLVALWLVPDERGMGTHEQLGLPSCETCRLLGVEKCPSCGMTTGTSLSVRGRLAEAWEANPVSILFFLTLLTGVAVGGTGLWLGEERGMPGLFVFIGIQVVLALAMLARWGWFLWYGGF